MLFLENCHHQPKSADADVMQAGGQRDEQLLHANHLAPTRKLPCVHFGYIDMTWQHSSRTLKAL